MTYMLGMSSDLFVAVPCSQALSSRCINRYSVARAFSHVYYTRIYFNLFAGEREGLSGTGNVYRQ